MEHNGLFSNEIEIKKFIKQLSTKEDLSELLLSNSEFLKEEWDKAIMQTPILQLHRGEKPVMEGIYFDKFFTNDRGNKREYEMFCLHFWRHTILCPDETIFQTELEHGKVGEIPGVKNRLGFETPCWVTKSRGLPELVSLSTQGKKEECDFSEIVEWTSSDQYVPIIDGPPAYNFITGVKGTLGFSIKYNVGFHALVNKNSRPVTFRKVSKNWKLEENREVMEVLKACWENNVEGWVEFSNCVNLTCTELFEKSIPYEIFTHSTKLGKDKDSSEMYQFEKEAISLLKIEHEAWDEGVVSEDSVFTKKWEDLTNVERGALVTLGYSEKEWCAEYGSL